jgi:hypothetical protein
LPHAEEDHASPNHDQHRPPKTLGKIPSAFA